MRFALLLSQTDAKARVELGEDTGDRALDVPVGEGAGVVAQLETTSGLVGFASDMMETAPVAMPDGTATLVIDAHFTRADQ